jgi:hypothetical protein
MRFRILDILCYLQYIMDFKYITHTHIFYEKTLGKRIRKPHEGVRMICKKDDHGRPC